MVKPKITQELLYQLLRDGKIEEFNHRIAKGESVDLTSCDFRHLNLQGLIANGLDFSNSYFRQADLRGIDFSQSVSLQGASIHGAKISGVYFPEQLTAEEISLSLLHGTRMRYNN
ncbi:pentapeptide repeat-containing protein [Methylophaga nitratireducenticrescens]|uniref:Pentapeptide repeat domain protein n=1 Tax=Methylophaga nitratireducenticrescens TaxID=754476 RepID=I1XFI5_METNJ|nr:pentapeptide repeat-containing protein [Methylophaga nitratireducenticrescens]AFI83154.1 pentapeptide repeat protein [Methylophaga nitratireducenticrescens]AUZ83296.1 pentapeptide repeat protein [Methylophaga nitratireducenticrescens]